MNDPRTDFTRPGIDAWWETAADEYDELNLDDEEYER